MGQDTDWFRHVIDAVDIVLVAYIIYRGLLFIRGTRATPMLIGLGILVALFALAQALGFVTLFWLLSNFLSSLILVVVVLFQEEIRRGLTKVGLGPVFRRSGKVIVDKALEDITLVSARLADSKTGALIVIQREVGLDEFVEESVSLDALLNRKLLYGLFVKDSPLHDGAVLIDGSRIRAAGCVLPLSFDTDLDPNLGTRHRAALGLSERSDAIIIVVSEETGAISIAHEGRLLRNLDGPLLRESLVKIMAQKEKEEREEEVA